MRLFVDNFIYIEKSKVCKCNECNVDGNLQKKAANVYAEQFEFKIRRWILCTEHNENEIHIQHWRYIVERRTVLSRIVSKTRTEYGIYFRQYAV